MGADPVDTLGLARRLDWRFLLADLRLERVAVSGAPDALLLAALGQFAASVADADASPADVVMACRPSAPELRAAIGRVGPGGSIVVELVGPPRLRRGDRLTAASANAVAARLRRDGCTDVAAYWTWPDHATGAEIVPLDDRPLVRLALGRHGGGRASRLKVRLAQTLVRTGLGAAILPATTVVGRRPNPDAGSTVAGSAPLIDAFIAANRDRLGLDGLIDGPTTTLLVTPRFKASAHVVGLVAPLRSGRPAVVVKIHRLAGATRTLETEAASLGALAELRPGGTAGVPRLLAHELVAGHAALIETALAGRPLDPAEVRRDRSGAIDAVGSWLRGLRHIDPPAGDDDRWVRLIEPALDALGRVLADDAQDTEAVRRARELLAPLRTAGLPVVIEHGDLSHPNLLVLDEGPPPRIGVVDWELGEPHGLPLLDLLFFLGYVAFAERRLRTPSEHADAIEAAFCGPTAWAATAAALAAEEAGIDRALLGPLLVATWTRALARLLGRLDGDPDQRPDEDADAVAAGRRLRDHRYHAIWRRVVDRAPDVRWDIDA
jgi:aminoglycoside phosphotransferase (APT) family kinase protein